MGERGLIMKQTIDAFWDNFLKETKLENVQLHDAWAFGDSASLADDLASLTVKGIKTATASAYIEYVLDHEALPQVSDHALDIILDGQGQPVAVIRVTKVYVVPFLDVTPEYAYKEGEADRSLDSWRKIHHQYWQRTFEARGLAIEIDQIDVVCEEFEVVWHPQET